MKVTVKATKPDDVEVEITLRMSLGDARAMANDLGQKYPAWKLASAIRQAIFASSRTFDAELVEGPQP